MTTGHITAWKSLKNHRQDFVNTVSQEKLHDINTKPSCWQRLTGTSPSHHQAVNNPSDESASSSRRSDEAAQVRPHPARSISQGHLHSFSVYALVSICEENASTTSGRRGVRQ